MTQQEFTARTGYTPQCEEEFWAIHDEYVNSPFNKDEFCKVWLRNFLHERPRYWKRRRIKAKPMKIMTVSGKRITRYTVLLLCAMTVFSSCGRSNGAMQRAVMCDSVSCNITKSSVLPSDTDPIQIAICKRLLRECAQCGILDNAGVCALNRINEHPSVSRYMELIDECTNEDNFADTVMEGDTWQEYVERVIIPRQELCND